MPRRIGDPIIALAFLATAGAFLGLTFAIGDAHAALFPRALALAVLACGTGYFVRSVRGHAGRREPPLEEGVEVGHFVKLLGLCLLYLPAMAMAGYVAATAAFIVIGLYLLGYRHLRVALTVAVLVTVLVFVVFKTLMYASLPNSVLDDWLTEILYRYVLS